MTFGTDRDDSAEKLFPGERAPVIVLAPLRRGVPWRLAFPAVMLAVLAAASHTLWLHPRQASSSEPRPSDAANGSPPSAPAPPEVLERAPFPPFPKNGTAVVDLPRGLARSAEVTIEAGAADSGAHWVVNLRGWASGTWIATLYLDAASVTTLFLPAGEYQVSAAAGDVWEGDTRLFGDATHALRFRAPVRLASGPSNHRLIELPPQDGSPPAAIAVPSFTIRTR